jgi:phosphohistidine swiveling domain-containing protein
VGETDPIEALLESIAAEFEVMTGRPERVSDACARIRGLLSWPPTAQEVDRLLSLLPLLRQRLGEINLPLFSLLEDVAARSEDAWPFLEGMLASREEALSLRALAMAARLTGEGSLAVDRRSAQLLADRVEAEGSPLGSVEALATIGRILRGSAPEGPDPVLALYRDGGAGSARRLAARLLDLDGQPASLSLAEGLLGPRACAFLGPYLSYTRASHLDLLGLLPGAGGPPPCLASFEEAESTCGEELLRLLIAELGWSRVSLGLEVRPYVCLGVRGSIPLAVSPAEAPLLESGEDVRRTSEGYLIVAHGGRIAGGADAGGAGAVARFRAYNLAHAEALSDILDVAPLTREKAARILGRMDGIVEDFTALFAAYAPECAVLPGLYRELRARIVSELETETSPGQLSAELTRLMQSFEDPRSLGEVRTLHGLKRFLHQRGLELGFRLIETRGATSRTVDLVLASRRRILQTVRKISYVDFEPGTTGQVPYPVQVIADGFARQLVHAHETFPSVQVFCYGNEVHYYLAYRNHPAFLRIDFAPPLLGGMIDLEYYAVSAYELAIHPNPSLDALRLFFRRLEFDVRLEGTRVHARYDKERALDLGDLCEKAELFSCLVPFLMDVDWVIGSLNLDAGSRRTVGEAWSESFCRWGVLPYGQLLTRDRQGILLAVESGPVGEREVAWSGELPYRDRFRIPPPAGLLSGLQASIAALGLDEVPFVDDDADLLIGQLRLERGLLRPLREALARGELVETPEGLRTAPAGLFEPRHEAEAFAEILGSDRIAPAALLARLLSPLERTLRFRGTGRVNGYDLQRARLALRGESLGLYVLRDGGGIVRLALFSHGDVLWRRRSDPEGPWSANWSDDPVELAALLRRNSYLPLGAGPPTPWRPEDVAAIRDMFRRPNPTPSPPSRPGENVLRGFRASPGRAVGTALFGTAGRNPEEFDGAVLVAPSVRPEDNTFLFHARGIVSTGGGILSHAGLIATQFHKPALIVSGVWQREPDGFLTLLYRTPEYREEQRDVDGWRISLYRDWHEREHRLREGDLLVLDAAEGTLTVLGQHPDALALHEGFRLFGEAGLRLARAEDEREILNLRGRRLRGAHQIRKLLSRLTDPVLARHAAHELLLGENLSEDAASRSERAQLLSLLLDNSLVGGATREYVVRLTEELRRRHEALAEETVRRLRTAGSSFEVLAQRLEVLRVRQVLGGASVSLSACGLEVPGPSGGSGPDVDLPAARRLEELRGDRVRALRDRIKAPALDPRARHLLRQIERLDRVLGLAEEDDLRRARTRIASEDESARRRLWQRRVVTAEDGGFEIHSLIGWKGANLAEVERLGGRGLVPPWFVVTDRAFAEVLDAPLERPAAGVDPAPPGATTLREAIDALLGRTDLDNVRKSARIRSLWDRVALPEALRDDVAAAYRRLTAGPGSDDDDGACPFVAVRSSAREEDAEVAARAGEFETFLFIRGEERLFEFLKRAWSGLWTERAIHNRTVLGMGSGRTGGGIIIQRIVWSRVSGVIQTVNIAGSDLREMVINAGLGLGEGIVSGAVGADHIVVAKEGDLERDALRFRYVTADKREKMVFNRRAGFGTLRSECLYHQRLRPALEYVELRELVRLAARLESDYGYPLDIEFGIEGPRLFLLQARPVAMFQAALRDTVARHPLAVAAAHLTAEKGRTS